MPQESLLQSVAALPQSTGVYLFKDEQGEVLYVGKALRLKDRVRSYFASDLAVTRNSGLVRMVNMAVKVDHELAPTELEALMLEARLIRHYKPRYNIKLRDDKSFVVIKIDLSHDFPPVTIGREKELEDALIKHKRLREGVRIKQKVDHIEYYGPFTSAGSVREALKSIRSIWPFRDCTPAKYKTYEALGHGCLFGALGVCTAPCVHKVTKEEYRKNIDQVRAFLRGDKAQVMQVVQMEMQAAAEAERYEEAARHRNRLYALEHFQHIIDTFRDARGTIRVGHTYNPEADLRIECYDISNNTGMFAVGSCVCGIIRDGKITPVTTKDDARTRFLFERDRYRKFKVRTIEKISDTDMLHEVLGRRLKRGKGKLQHWSLPDFILVDGGKGQLSSVLSERREAELEDAVAMGTVAKGPTRKNVDLYGDDWEKFPQMSREAWQQVAEQLREEAHRFAITYYRALHRKSLLGLP
ncbi:MAG TPA: GIY-YIG nuclease family protein [Verrucomicrobiae bacterium]|nr:GIY-YIG nuclease family protein [Verrucomicrobiae bacterium]